MRDPCGRAELDGGQGPQDGRPAAALLLLPCAHTHAHTCTPPLLAANCPPPPPSAGFSLAGGAVWASATFLLAFLLYRATVVPAEERMLREAYGDEYDKYA